MWGSVPSSRGRVSWTERGLPLGTMLALLTSAMRRKNQSQLGGNLVKDSPPARVLIPRIEHLGQCGAFESALGQAIFDLERLPELLPEALVVELPICEVIMPPLSVKSRESLGFLGEIALIQGLVHQEHDVIVDCVDRRYDAQKLAAWPEAGTDGPAGSGRPGERRA